MERINYKLVASCYRLKFALNFNWKSISIFFFNRQSILLGPKRSGFLVSSIIDKSIAKWEGNLRLDRRMKERGIWGSIIDWVIIFYIYLDWVWLINGNEVWNQ